MLYTGVGQVSTSFKADSRRNLVSALAKLYPSPDWNVGVDRINLCDGNCTWKRTIVKDLYPWDAGKTCFLNLYLKFTVDAKTYQMPLRHAKIMNNKQSHAFTTKDFIHILQDPTQGMVAILNSGVGIKRSEFA